MEWQPLIGVNTLTWAPNTTKKHYHFPLWHFFSHILSISKWHNSHVLWVDLHVNSMFILILTMDEWIRWGQCREGNHPSTKKVGYFTDATKPKPWWPLHLGSVNRTVLEYVTREYKYYFSIRWPYTTSASHREATVLVASRTLPPSRQSSHPDTNPLKDRLSPRCVFHSTIIIQFFFTSCGFGDLREQSGGGVF